MTFDENAIHTAIENNPKIKKLSPKERGEIEKVMKSVYIEGKTFGEALGFSSQMLEETYAFALSFFRAGNYSKAHEIFRFIYLMNPDNAKFTQALACSFHKLRDYTSAINYYYLWSTLDAKTPLPFFYMSDCYEQLNMLDDQKMAIEMTIKKCGKLPEFQSLKSKLQLQLDGLNNKINDLSAPPKPASAPMPEASKEGVIR